MSKTVKCRHCGKPMQVPAFPGDGVYEFPHDCSAMREVAKRQAEFEDVSTAVDYDNDCAPD